MINWIADSDIHWKYNDINKTSHFLACNLLLESDVQSKTNATDYDYVIIEGETVRYECSVKHSGGDWLPQIDFDYGLEGIEIEEFDCRVPEDDENIIRQCVDIVIDQISGELNYSCSLTFPPPPVDGDRLLPDPRPPDFESTHTFQQLEVHCKSFFKTKKSKHD